MELTKCPKCGSSELRKNGFVCGTQRFLCKNCNFQFTKEKPHGKDTKMKAMALSLCHCGLSANQVAKILSITPTSIARWYTDFPKDIRFTFTENNHLESIEESSLKSYIRSLYLNNKQNFLIARNKFASGYEVDVLVKDIRNTVQPSSNQLIVTGIGDSILEGIIHDDDQNKYTLLNENFVNLTKNHLNVKWFNLAKHGATVKEGIKQFKENLQKIHDSNYVVLSFGSNECSFNWDEISYDFSKKHTPLMSLEAFHKKYIELIKQIQKRDKMPLLLSLPPLDSKRIFKMISENRNKENLFKFFMGNTDNIYSWHDMYNLEIFKIAQEANVQVIDITTPFLQQMNYSKFLCDDGIHPNAKGHQLIAKTLVEFYKKYF